MIDKIDCGLAVVNGWWTQLVELVVHYVGVSDTAVIMVRLSLLLHGYDDINLQQLKYMCACIYNNAKFTIEV